MTPNHARIRIHSLLFAGLAASTLAQAQPAPAFLDRPDEIAIHVGGAQPLDRNPGRFAVRVEGREIGVKSVRGGEETSRPVDANFVNLPGTMQSKLGGRDWDPAGRSTQLRPMGGDIFELVVKLPAGFYHYKVTKGGSWDQNWGQGFAQGGENFSLSVPSPQVVRFVVDFGARRVLNSIANPTEVTAPALAPAMPTESPTFSSFRLTLDQKIAPADVMKAIEVRDGLGQWRRVIARGTLDWPEFVYGKRDLGATWAAQSTTFKVWSPVANSCEVVLFDTATSAERKRVPMVRGTAGVWYATVPGNLDGTYYHYRLISYGRVRVAADIYAKAADVTSDRSMVIDLRRTRPAGWPAKRLFEGKSHVDAVIYEAHVRDLTVDPSGGVPSGVRGKYLGLAQTGTRVPGTSQATGLDYLKRLGITHLHLLPFQDISMGSADEYNWGYATKMFDVPESQYGTRPTDPAATIRECKEMILRLQQNGIGVVLDVVYNHSVPSEGEGSAFWELVPYYYFRTNDRGDVLNESGVGNALHDERPMVRKFIADSLAYWAREYRLDGFRFDLIGMFTRESNMAFERAIRAENPHAIVYGEPWTGGGPTRFGKGDQRGTGVAVFNDFFRGLFRGGTDDARPGFLMGASVSRPQLESALTASLKEFADSPTETINYLSAHDNYTWRDKIAASMPNASAEDREQVVKLGLAVTLLGQGVPFIEGGVEMGRTKGMNPNSYNAGDSVNRFDWASASKYQATIEYLRNLVQIRRENPELRLATKSDVQKAVRFPRVSEPNQVVMIVEGSKVRRRGRDVVVLLNTSARLGKGALPPGRWRVLSDSAAKPMKVGTVARYGVSVGARSCVVLVRQG